VNTIRSPGRCDISEFYIELSEYEKLNRLGSGAVGAVFRARHKRTGDIVAIKEIACNVNDDKAQERFEREIQILGTVRHPALLTLYGCTPYVPNTLHSPMILTPFMSHGSVEDMLRKERNGTAPAEWTSTRKHIVLFGIASGMMFMHEHRIIHRDLKPDNVLLDDRYEPKIADFGLSKYVAPNQSLLQSMNPGTPRFMAPELFSDGEFNFKVDVYAFGIVLYMIVTGLEPFPEITNPFVLGQKVVAGIRPPIPASVPEGFSTLISACWDQDPKHRPLFSHVVHLLGQDEFLSNIDHSMFTEYRRRVSPAERIFQSIKSRNHFISHSEIRRKCSRQRNCHNSFEVDLF
jgi:serine/threonine protein kinase